MGAGLTPKNEAPRLTTQRKMWSDDDQSLTSHLYRMGGHHSRPRPHRVGTNERAGRPKLGGGRLHHQAECGAQRRPRYQKTRLRRPRRLKGVREGGGCGVRARVGGEGGGGRPRRGADRVFLFFCSWSFLFSANWGEGDLGASLGRLCWTGIVYGHTRKSLPPFVRQRRNRCHGPSGRI